MPYQSLELLAALFSLPFLFYACYSDIRTREVDDEVWIIFLAVALPINLLRIFLYRKESNILLIGGISITFALFLAVFFVAFGLIGGADGKALICISFISPLPITSELSLFEEIVPLSLTFFMNTYLFSIPMILILMFQILSHNIFHYRSKSTQYALPSVPLWKKVILFFIGWPEELETIKKRHHWHYVFLEEKINNQWQIIIRKKVGDPDEDFQKQMNTIDQLIEDGRASAWIHPVPPGLLPMTIGYYAALLLGNLMIRFLAFLFGQSYPI